MKNTDYFHYKGEPSHATTKLTLFADSTDEWDTKEDTGKSMKNVCTNMKNVCTYCSMPKGISWPEAMLNSEQIKPVVLAIIELRLSEGISRLLSQSLENSIN